MTETYSIYYEIKEFEAIDISEDDYMDLPTHSDVVEFLNRASMLQVLKILYRIRGLYRIEVTRDWDKTA